MDLVLFPTIWDFVASFLIFTLGAGIIAHSARYFQVPPVRALLLYVWHSFFCVLYTHFVLLDINTWDAAHYYQNSLGDGNIFTPGMDAIEVITGVLAKGFGMSFLTASLVYNICGSLGLIAFDGALRIATAGKSANPRRLATLIILLPSVSFWSSAIGKDSLAFMAAAFALWAALHLKKRL